VPGAFRRPSAPWRQCSKWLQLLDRHVRFNSTIFCDKWDNLQIGVNGPNSGFASSKGIETAWNCDMCDSRASVLHEAASSTYLNTAVLDRNPEYPGGNCLLPARIYPIKSQIFGIPLEQIF
jgi:hypothetical protein